MSAVDLTTAERHLDAAHMAVEEWHARETTPERTYVSAGHEAIAAIDGAMAALYVLRSALIGEIRRDEDERNERVDLMLAEVRAAREARPAGVTA